METYKKLLTVQTKLKAPKSQWNNFSSYYYRNCEDILEAVKPLLAEVNALIVIGDEVVMVGERYYVKATARFIDCETGKVIENSSSAREEESKKGMDGSQITGASSSYARKYALNGLLAIDDTKDSDTTNKHEKNDTETVEKCTVEQIEEMRSLKINEANVCKAYGVKKIEDLSKVQADMAITKKLTQNGGENGNN